MGSAGQASSRVTRRIGRYQVLGRIGQGGMGRVYRAFDEVLEREIAVKTLTGGGPLEQEHRQRFAIEAKAAARLQHPNIVTVFELGEDRGAPFIAMELLGGADLETLSRSGQPLLLAEQLEILAQVCRGLHFAHEHGIVHRDVKPSNIRVLEDGSAKIMDFGIAKLGAGGVTRTGMTVGTVHYMSPEQILGKTLDGRSDVFSLGVIVHELVSGSRPFSGDEHTEVLYNIVNQPPALLPQRIPEREPLQALIDAALAKDRDRRIPSAARMADELSRILAEHRRHAPQGLPREAQEALRLARCLIKEGRVEEGLGRLRRVTAQHPLEVEAWRALRWATRDFERRRDPAPEASDDFPELASGFLEPPTLIAELPTQVEPRMEEPATLYEPRTLDEAPPALPEPGSRTRRMALIGGVMLAALTALGLWLSLGTPVERLAPAAPAAAASSVAPPSVRAAREPASAAAPAVVPATLAGEAAAPASMPAAAPGELAVSSTYPVDVVWQGRTLARNQTSPRVPIASGTQPVTLVSAEHFLRWSVRVNVPIGGAAELTVPAPGRLNVRASPDNCQVFVDGVFLDYPPVLDRPMAAGTHGVAFKWPDGVSEEHSVEITPGAPAYVMGRKR